MDESHRSTRLESTPVDLLEVFYVNSGVVFIEVRKGLLPV